MVFGQRLVQSEGLSYFSICIMGVPGMSDGTLAMCWAGWEMRLGSWSRGQSPRERLTSGVTAACEKSKWNRKHQNALRVAQ